MIKKYRKIPVEVDVLQYTGDNIKQCLAFCIRARLQDSHKLLPNLIINTLQGDMLCNINDYIIKGVLGEFYPCKPEAFKKTYQEVNI